MKRLILFDLDGTLPDTLEELAGNRIITSVPALRFELLF